MAIPGTVRLESLGSAGWLWIAYTAADQVQSPTSVCEAGHLSSQGKEGELTHNTTKLFGGILVPLRPSVRPFCHFNGLAPDCGKSIAGLAQDCGNSIANTLELPQSFALNYYSILFPGGRRLQWDHKHRLPATFSPPQCCHVSHVCQV